jgi:hypothetical protein
MVASTTFAVPTLGMVDQFSGAPYTPWSVLYSDGGGISETGGRLEITTESGIPTTLIIQTTDGAWGGDYSYTGIGGGPWQTTIEFNFTTPNNSEAPVALGVYFVSGVNTWMYSYVTPGYGKFDASIATYAGWVSQSNPLLGESDFLVDITSIDTIGLYVQGTSAGNTYYLDDFGIAVPEPETVWMILAVLLSLGVTFRSQLAGMAGQVKARVFGA